MDNNVKIILKDFKEDVRDVLQDHMKEMIVYGSYARGDNTENSDIDVMFLVDLTDDELREYERKIWDMTYDYEMDRHVDISAMLKNIDHFNHWKDDYAFYSNVENEGVLI